MKNSLYAKGRRSGLIIGLAGLALLLAGCADSDESSESDSGESERSARPVMVEKIKFTRESTFVEAIGTSRALRSVTLESAVTGEVAEVSFSPGERVERGQVLLRLDDRDERLAVDLAEVELADAERRLDRYQRSIRSGGVTQSDLDEATSGVDRARIALQRAQVHLDYHTIKAPFSGHVGLTELDPGAWISPDSEIASLDDRSTLLVRFQLPEILLGQLEPGQIVRMSTWSDRFAIAEGEIVDVSSRVDETRRTFTLRAHVDNQDDILRPGMSFRIQLALEGNQYPKVPEISLQWGGEGAYVWTVEDGEAKRITVNIVQRRDNGVLVEGDIPEGTFIVTEGVHAVRDGARVRPINVDLETASRGDES